MILQLKDRGQVTKNFTECNACLLDTAFNITAGLAMEKGGPFGVTTGQLFRSSVCYKEMSPKEIARCIYGVPSNLVSPLIKNATYT